MKIPNCGTYYKIIKNAVTKNGTTGKIVAGQLDKPVLKNSVLEPAHQELLEVFKQKYNYKKHKPVQWALKRGIDYIGGTIGAVVSSPVLLLSAALIKLESKGPVMFKQVRVGKDGREFVIYKLRTMKTTAPKKYAKVSSGNDPRITKTGKILRKFSIDEFPQFINILKGDMSLIGPRPIMDDLTSIDPNSVRRYAVKPGLRLKYKAQKSDDLVDRITTEKEYLEKWNLKKDFSALYSTIKAVLTGKNC